MPRKNIKHYAGKTQDPPENAPNKMLQTAPEIIEIRPLFFLRRAHNTAARITLDATTRKLGKVLTQAEPFYDTNPLPPHKPLGVQPAPSGANDSNERRARSTKDRQHHPPNNPNPPAGQTKQDDRRTAQRRTQGQAQGTASQQIKGKGDGSGRRTGKQKGGAKAEEGNLYFCDMTLCEGHDLSPPRSLSAFKSRKTVFQKVRTRENATHCTLVGNTGTKRTGGPMGESSKSMPTSQKKPGAACRRGPRRPEVAKTPQPQRNDDDRERTTYATGAMRDP